jgi:hypothetical protein
LKDQKALPLLRLNFGWKEKKKFGNKHFNIVKSLDSISFQGFFVRDIK